jgi:formylglycine-generating enzyme required for sulfatase activity
MVGVLGAGAFYMKARGGGVFAFAGAKGPAAPVSARAPVQPAPPPPPTCPDGMVKVPGGRFFMGSDEGLPLEKPAHKVAIAPFCMDVFEVSTAQFKKCSDEGDCKRAGTTNDWDGITDHERKVFDPQCNVRDVEQRGSHPINCVDWEMADIFCRSYGKRLPTEAEWEFAARGPDGRKYPWGDDPPSGKFLNACGKECVAWGKKNQVDETAMYPSDDGWATTAPVGTYPAGMSRYGVQDVVGNVWEWVADWYAPYEAADQVEPKGPPEGENRVIRGGAWNGAYDSWVRPTFRYRDNPTKRSYGIGFRCAKSLEGATPPPASTVTPGGPAPPASN